MLRSKVNELRSKRIGLVLSSGFFGFYAHAGCLAALDAAGIQPVGYAGSSAGAIIAAFAAAGIAPGRIKEILFGLEKEHFWDPEPLHKTVLGALRLFRGWEGRVQGKKIHALVAQHLPVHEFKSLQHPCIVTATNLTRKSRHVFSSGSVADAVQASCAVPWLFRIKQLGSEMLIDGGFVDKAPLVALADILRPEVLIVSYLTSDNLQEHGNGFMNKLFAPQRAFMLSVNIARQEYYRLQKHVVEARGIEVIELCPPVPAVHPNRLYAGRDAYQAAFDYTATFCAR